MEMDTNKFVSRSIDSTALLVSQAEMDGLDLGMVLRGSNLRADDFNDPLREVEASEELQVVKNLLALGVSSEFAFRVGVSHRISRLGLLGYALLHSDNIRGVVELCHRFMPLTFSFCRVDVDESEFDVRITFSCDLQPLELAEFLVVRDMASLASLTREVTGRRVVLRRWTMVGHEGGLFPGYERYIDGDPEFGKATNCWVLDRRLMDYPLPRANLPLRSQCVEACEALLLRKQAHSGIEGEIRNLLMRSEHRLLSLEELAARFCCTPRTLRRRLAVEAGTTYRDLANEARQAIAITMLHDRRLQLSEISSRLGYQNASSFTSAFRRWTGKSPSEYRQAAFSAGVCREGPDGTG